MVEVHEQHLHADERQDQHQAVPEVAEDGHQPRDGEVQRPQAEDRERVRREHQERVLGNRQDCRDRIHREHDVRELDHHEGEQQRCRVQPAGAPHQKLRAVEFVGDRDEPPQHPGREALAEVPGQALVVGAHHPDRRHQQRRAEHVEHPVERVEQRSPRADHETAQHDGPDDAPEEHPVLKPRRHAQEIEDDGHHEDVVDRQRPLEQVAGDVLKHGAGARGGAVVVRDEAEPVVLVQAVDRECEAARDADPDGGPEQRLWHRELLGLAVQHREVEGQEPEEQHDETGPDELGHRHAPR